jgi:hypothetical protein
MNAQLSEPVWFHTGPPSRAFPRIAVEYITVLMLLFLTAYRGFEQYRTHIKNRAMTALWVAPLLPLFWVQNKKIGKNPLFSRDRADNPKL